MTLQTCAFNWVLGVPAAKLMKRSSRASDKVNQRLVASVGNNKHPARMSPAMPDFTLNSLRQRFRSSPDVGCRAFCIPLRLWWSVEQEKCVHTCSRPPSTGAQTPSCTLVNAASKDGPNVQFCVELFHGRRTGFALGHSQHRETGVSTLARGCWPDEASVRRPTRFSQIHYRSIRQLRFFTSQIHFQRNACSVRGSLGQPESRAHRFVETQHDYHRLRQLSTNVSKNKERIEFEYR